jgi:hypothetical protein
MKGVEKVKQRSKMGRNGKKIRLTPIMGQILGANPGT